MALSVKTRTRLLLLLIAAIIACDIAVARTASMQGTPEMLALAVAADWLIFIPLILYAINKLRSPISILLALVAGCLATMWIVPDNGSVTLKVLRYVLIPLELGLLSCEAVKLVQFIRLWRATKRQFEHPIEAARSAISTAMGEGLLPRMLAHDLSMFYYAFFSWKRRPYVPQGAAIFHVHQKSNWFMTVLILTKVIIIEAFAVHLLLAQWSPAVAWIVTAGDFYLLVYLWSDFRAMVLNPLTVRDGKLRIRIGLRQWADIDLSMVAEATASSVEIPLSKEDKKTASYPIFEEPNLLLRLHQPIPAIGPFGTERNTDRIYLRLDNPQQLVQLIRNYPNIL